MSEAEIEPAGSPSPFDEDRDYCKADATDDERVPWDECQNPAGWGTDHQGTGLCILHEDDPEHLPDYGLFEPNHGYYTRQDKADRKKLEKIAYDITQRIINLKGFHDEVDREFAREIAVDMHLVRRTSEYVAKPLVETNTRGDKEVNKLLHQHRMLQESIITRLTKYGIMYDPESKKADATREKVDAWREMMEEDF